MVDVFSGLRVSVLSRPVLSKLRAVLLVAGCALALSGCFSESMLGTNAKQTQPLSSEMIATIESKGMTKESPILVRIFKEESELEVWKQTKEGKYDLLKTYPICRWSGGLGPKVKTGDRQAPEGFYMITPGLMNPNSAYYLAFNMGFPNAFDRSLNRTGSNLMVHGDCSSAGCYAMTDEQIGEIFALARDAFQGGQRAFQVQAYPFRMTPKNMAKHRNNPNIAFWRMLKEGSDHFEVTRQEPKVEVCDRRYVFNAIPFDPAQTFNPQRSCPVYDQPIEVAEAVKAKRDADQKEYAALVSRGLPTESVTAFRERDGGMNPVFAAKFPDRVPEGQRVAVAPANEPPSMPVQAAPLATEPAPSGPTVIPAMASTERAPSHTATTKPGFLDKIGAWLGRHPEKSQTKAQGTAVASNSPAETRAASAPAPRPKPAVRTAAKQTPPAKPAAEKAAPEKAEGETRQAVNTLPGATPILSSGGFSAFH